MPELQLDHVGLHHEVARKPGAPWLVLSNSLGANLTMWDAQLPAFAEHFSVLRYNGRDQTAPPAPDAAYTLQQLSEDVLAIADHERIERFHFCGLSLGGFVGQWLASHHPSRIRRLVLCNTAPKIGTADVWNQRIRTVQAQGMQAIVEGTLERWFTPAFREAHPEALANTRAMLLAANPAGYAACCAAIRDMDQRDTIRDIHAPTLVVYGTQDPVTTEQDARLLTSSIANAQALPLPAAHLSNIEQAAGFTRGVLDFLQTAG